MTVIRIIAERPVRYCAAGYGMPTQYEPGEHYDVEAHVARGMVDRGWAEQVAVRPRVMHSVRGHFRRGRWINPHWRCSGYETRAQAHERVYGARLRLEREFCPSCNGTGWVFRDPPSATSPTKLCPTCEGSGRPWR